RGGRAAHGHEAGGLLALAGARRRGLRDLPVPRDRVGERAPLLRLPPLRGGNVGGGEEGEGVDPGRVPRVVAPGGLTYRTAASPTLSAGAPPSFSAAEHGFFDSGAKRV